MERHSIDRTDMFLGGADLREADLREVHWTKCDLNRALLQDANCSSATLRLCNLDGAQVQRARFDAARLEDSSAVGADFSLASFRGAHLTETSFSRAVLREAVLDDAEGDGIDFRGADLRSASLKGVRFDEADFRGADLRDADLSAGRFQSADFRGALLEGACFDRADYTGATFDQGETPFTSATTVDKGSTEAANRAATEDADIAGSAAMNTLNEFVSLLPSAISGAQPEELMQRVRQLIDQAAVSAGYSPEQQQIMRDHFARLTTPGGFDAAQLQQILAALNSDANEPPEELKAWLEPLMKTAQNGRKQ